MEIMGIIMDLGLGAMAFRLVRSLERTQLQQTEILSALTRRVEILEALLGLRQKE
jgi:hypothetical protein